MIYDTKQSEISRQSIEKWKIYGLGILHFVFFFLLVLFSEFDPLILVSYVIFIPATLLIIYNIFRYNYITKSFSYVNLLLLLVLLLRVISLSSLTMKVVYIILLSIPSFLNIICIKKYGEYPAIKAKEKYDEIIYPSANEVDEKLLKKSVEEKTISVSEHKKISDVTKTVIEKAEIKTTLLPKSHGSVVDVKTAFGYKGAAIIYKLKIENNTPDPISDIKVYPYIPDVFLLKEKEKSIALIEPKSSQTVTFEIRPTGECGDCNVSGRVNYYDMASRKRQDIELEPKSLSIVCPMLHGKEISEAEWHDTVSNLVKTEESTREIDMPSESLFTMVSRIVKDMHMHMQKPEVTQNHKLFNGVARFYGEGVKGLKYAAQVEVVGGAKKSKLILKAWAEKEDALTGFYHGILDEIEKRVKVKEYIDDSIVQYNVHIGDKIGTLVKDSVVQRSTIGVSARKCPNCGREVEANEKFCLECGAKL